MQYALDSCYVFRGMLVVEGWSESGAPEVLYQGMPIRSLSTSMPRPDVFGAFGEHAENWGFRVCAMMAPDMNRDGFSLRFDGTEVVTALTNDASDDRYRFNGMTRQLLAQSKPGHRVLEIGSRARSGNTNRDLVHRDVDSIAFNFYAASRCFRGIRRTRGKLGV